MEWSALCQGLVEGQSGAELIGEELNRIALLIHGRVWWIAEGTSSNSTSSPRTLCAPRLSLIGTQRRACLGLVPWMQTGSYDLSE